MVWEGRNISLGLFELSLTMFELSLTMFYQFLTFLVSDWKLLPCDDWRTLLVLWKEGWNLTGTERMVEHFFFVL